MNAPRSYADPALPDELVSVAERLRSERLGPPGGLRGRLRGELNRPAPRPRPENLRALLARFAAASGALLVLGTLAAAGAGPFGS